LYGAEDKLQALVLDLPHGYTPPMREAMLGWFNLHLKGMGDGSPVKDLPFELVSEDNLMTFERGKIAADGLYSTEAFCKKVGNDLRNNYLNNSGFDPERKRKELRELLGIEAMAEVKKVHQYGTLNGWDRRVLETSDGKLIPMLLKPPKNNDGAYTLIFNPLGKAEVSDGLIEDLEKKGSGIVLVDLSGTGEVSSEADDKQTISRFHSVARAKIWLGRTLIGEWVEELKLVCQYLTAEQNAGKIHIDGSKEGGLAALFLAALERDRVDAVVVRDTPLSYLFDTAAGVDYYNMGIHLPGFLEWGDISLAAALGGNTTFVDPRTMSGNSIVGEDLQHYKREF